MIALLRADLFRLRGRRDLIVVLGGLLIIHGIVFLQAYAIASGNADLVTSVPPPETEAKEFLRTQQEYRVQALASFAPPASASTILMPGFPVLVAGVAFLAAMVMGSDFEWGTVRSGVLLAGSRRRFILIRQLTCWVVVGLVIAILIAIGLVLPLLISATGAPVGWRPDGLGSNLASVVGTAYHAVLYASIAVAVTTVARSLAGGIIGTTLIFVADTFANVALRPTLPAVAKLSISGSLGDLADPQGATQPVVSLVTAAAWLVLAVVISLVAMQRRDILE